MRCHFTSLMLVSIVLLSLGLRLEGITNADEHWDEAAVITPGATYLQLWSKLDFSAMSWEVNREHPPVAKYLYGATKILPRIFPFVAEIDKEFLPGKQFSMGRVLSAILGTFSVLILFFLGRTMYDEGVGLMSAAILATLPHVVAHNRIIGLETPLLLFTLLSVFFFVKRRFLVSSIFFGLSLGTRFNAALMWPLFVLCLPLYHSISLRSKEAIKIVLTLTVVPLTVFFLSWPWLWSNPIGHLWESIGFSARGTSGEYFLGSFRSLPWYYYFSYVLATTPTVILGLLGVFLMTRGMRLLRYARNDEENKGDKLLILYLFLPFLASFFSLKQDGVRYIYQFYPALALAAGIGFFSMLSWLRRALGRISIIIITFIIIINIIGVISVRPYYLDYYNALVGGPKKVYQSKLFEVGWWGEGIKAAVSWVNENAPQGVGVNYAFSPQHVAPILRDDLVLSKGSIEQEYVISNTYTAWYEKIEIDQKEYVPVHVVSVQDVPLVTIYEKSTPK